MSDIRDWAALIRGRWNWSRYGYEDSFPRGCQFTDLDGATEFDGRSLLIETKQHDGLPDVIRLPDRGQLLFLQDEVKRGKTVLVLYGCGVCNDPQAVYHVNRSQLMDWRGKPKPERRLLLKQLIDESMALTRSGNGNGSSAYRPGQDDPPPWGSH